MSINEQIEEFKGEVESTIELMKTGHRAAALQDVIELKDLYEKLVKTGNELILKGTKETVQNYVKVVEDINTLMIKVNAYTENHVIHLTDTVYCGETKSIIEKQKRKL